MKPRTTHKENLHSLKRIEGQVRGIQRMVADEKYCIDIVNQLHAAINALYRVSEKILVKHIESCVIDTFKGKSKEEKFRKVAELRTVIRRRHSLR